MSSLLPRAEVSIVKKKYSFRFAGRLIIVAAGRLECDVVGTVDRLLATQTDVKDVEVLHATRRKEQAPADFVIFAIHQVVIISFSSRQTECPDANTHLPILRRSYRVPLTLGMQSVVQVRPSDEPIKPGPQRIQADGPTAEEGSGTTVPAGQGLHCAIEADTS